MLKIYAVSDSIGDTAELKILRISFVVLNLKLYKKLKNVKLV